MTARLPRITVVTPSLNQGQFLEESIRSVLDQDYPGLEYIVLDGGSNDGSEQIIERYSTRLAYWRSGPDDGQAAALREGFDRATGDILAWLNSDDLLAPGALEIVAKTWQRHGGDVMVAGACQLFDNSGARRRHVASFQEEFDRPEPLPLTRLLDLPHHWFAGAFFYQPEVFFPRAAYEAIGGINPQYHYVMDYDLWVRLAMNGTRVVVINRTLAHFRKHGAQKTSDRAAFHRETISTANEYLERVSMPIADRRRLQRWNRWAARSWVRRTFQIRNRMMASP